MVFALVEASVSWVAASVVAAALVSVAATASVVGVLRVTYPAVFPVNVADIVT